MGETGGINLYRTINNDLVGQIAQLGLSGATGSWEDDDTSSEESTSSKLSKACALARACSLADGPVPIGDIIGAGFITAALYNALRDYICKSTNVGDSEFPTKDDIPRPIEEIKKLEGDRGPRGPRDPKDKDRWRHLKDVLRRLQKKYGERNRGKDRKHGDIK